MRMSEEDSTTMESKPTSKPQSESGGLSYLQQIADNLRRAMVDAHVMWLFPDAEPMTDEQWAEYNSPENQAARQKRYDEQCAREEEARQARQLLKEKAEAWLAANAPPEIVAYFQSLEEPECL